MKVLSTLWNGLTQGVDGKFSTLTFWTSVAYGFSTWWFWHETFYGRAGYEHMLVYAGVVAAHTGATRAVSMFTAKNKDGKD